MLAFCAEGCYCRAVVTNTGGKMTNVRKYLDKQSTLKHALVVMLEKYDIHDRYFKMAPASLINEIVVVLLEIRTPKFI